VLTNRLLRLSLAASLAYFLFQSREPISGSVMLKGLSVTTLAAMVGRTLDGRDGLLLCLALAFGSLGDVLLDWNQDLFPAGLGAFLIGHFLYIALFLRNRPRPLRLQAQDKAIIAGLFVFAAVMGGYLLPATGGLAPAVAVYMCALTGMVICAVVLGLPERWLVIGALLFLTSDTILAISKFKSPVPGREFLIWPTYYIGQLLIAIGFLRAKGIKVP